MFGWYRKLRFKFRRWNQERPTRKFKRQLEKKKKLIGPTMEKFMAYELIRQYQHRDELSREQQRTGGAWRRVGDNRVPSPEVKVRLN